MAENEHNENFDFLCEKRLSRVDTDLHTRYRNSIFATDRLLANYKTIFPFYTDHTVEHSEQVTNYCNIIAGPEIVDQLNGDELYILLMGAALHDVGMGISESDFRDLGPKVPGLSDYVMNHPNESLGDYTRAFHQELSAHFVRKYSALFEIPSEQYIYGIGQVAKGHRRSNLFDGTAFPTDFLLENGHKVNLAYLAALVKLADELDVTSNRNLFFNYSQVTKENGWNATQIVCYKLHDVLKTLEVRSDALVLYYTSDTDSIEQDLLDTFNKIERTFNEYCEVTEKLTPYKNRLKHVLFEKI